ncbi:hypothetical protein BWK56_03370 [Candidatus Liberibacter asiaticus]|nr:DUF2155 domain-containing protein [Candidatus Liberibacter asiaticus]OMH86890.1 hypothetical protein BWK56_03370 [Candidatus Liberibacter asiaticus]
MKYRVLLLILFFVFSHAKFANSARFANKVAVFAGMDKITGRVLTFDVEINQSTQFGSLIIKPMVCYSRDDREAQRIDAFVSISEIFTDRIVRSIFSGWMFADSPAMNAIDHSIYDIWLMQCKDPINDSISNSESISKKALSEYSSTDITSQGSEKSSGSSSNKTLEKESSQPLENNLSMDLKGRPIQELGNNLSDSGLNEQDHNDVQISK